MKYIMIRDATDTFQKKRVLWTVYIICFISLCLFCKYILLETNPLIFTCLIGIRHIDDINILVTLFLFFNFLIYVYISYYVFLKDIQNDYGNIFSRISKVKWLLCKIISIGFITVILKCITILIGYFIFKVPIVLDEFVVHLLFIFFAQLVSLILYSLVIRYHRNFFVLILIGIVAFILCDIKRLTSSYYDKNFLFLFWIIAIFLYQYSLKKNMQYILERNG